jgi:glycosyltransferase involved in cell wall biosynthesis
MRTAMTARALYITYDGLTDPLGQSQVLPYLTGLSKRGHQITILSCEKRAAMDREGNVIRKLCAEAGLDWVPLPYHKRPPVMSSVFDLTILRRSAVRLHRSKAFTLVHCRSYIPAAAGLALKQRFGVPLLFDMRGFWPEEKTEGGSWDLRNRLFRLVYRYFKRLEKRLLSEADAIVTLTEAGKAELLRRRELRGREDRIEVIPCCVDVDHFVMADKNTRAIMRAELSIPEEARVLAYLGSLGGNYMTGEMLDLFHVYRERHPGARFLFVTREDPTVIRAEARRRDVSAEEVVIRSAGRNEVPRLLAAADLGIAFKQPSFSALGCSPTKMGEMLAVGLPVVANAGVGDVAEVLSNTSGGVAVTAFCEAEYVRALEKIDGLGTADERRRAAFDWFDVSLGIGRYDRIYARLSTSNPAATNASSNRSRNASRSGTWRSRIGYLLRRFTRF